MKIQRQEAVIHSTEEMRRPFTAVYFGKALPRIEKRRAGSCSCSTVSHKC